MEWFPLWLPLVSQLMVPVSLLAWLAFGRHATKARSIVVAALVATYVVALVTPLRLRHHGRVDHRTSVTRW
jgi:hypothetical protein